MSDDNKTKVLFNVYRGEKNEARNSENQQENKVEIPMFIPSKVKRKNSFDWEPYHEQIFIMLAEGKAIWNIATTLELEPSSVYNYIKRYGVNYGKRKRGGTVGI